MEAAREATAADLEAIVALAAEARFELSGKRGGEVLARLDPAEGDLQGRVAGALGSTEAFVAVGTIEEAVVGYALMYLVPASDGRPQAVVEELYVDPGARHVGVGEALMDLLDSEADGWGAAGVDSVALPGDRATKNFFEMRGMTARAIIVHHSLDG